MANAEEIYRSLRNLRRATAGVVVLALVAVVVVSLAAPNECDVTVRAPKSIQKAINNQPVGATICLSGRFRISSPIRPKDGQAFVGPAEITGSATVGFLLRSKGADTGAENVVIDNLNIHDFDLRAVGCWHGTRVLNSNLHHNGRNGMGCGLQGGGGVVVNNTLIHHNGDPATTGSGAGGMKFANCDGCTVRNSEIYENIGNGIWCDIDCHIFNALDNRVYGNTRKGIFVEISLGPALIERNIVQDNNCSPVYWDDGNPECDLPSGRFGPQSGGSPGGGIAANSSMHVTIRGNTGGGNMVAFINFRDDGRLYDAPFDILAEDNITNGDAILHCGIAGIVCRNNT